jgi:thiol-disulfide isomerase/thioredoxin
MKSRFFLSTCLVTIVFCFVFAAPAQKRHAGAVRSSTVRAINLDALKKLLNPASAKRRPLLVNFWATWCGPCRDEFPDLVKIDAENRNRDFQFVSISLDDISDIKTVVPQFLKEMKAKMPVYLLKGAEPEDIVKAVDPSWGGALPATFVFDGEGKIVFRHMGQINPDELRSELKKVAAK